jgi:CDP-paratose 2-epimerase
MGKRLLVTGGAGFIGSHAAEYFATRGYTVRVVDNLSRARLLKHGDRHATANWEFLRSRGDIELIRGDVRDADVAANVTADVDVILHAAAQTAVTTSVTDPDPDFSSNAIGTFRILEAARRSGRKPVIVYCSTNKVYGENVNAVPIVEQARRYAFGGEYTKGIPETFSIDRCEHTPYGCSKLTGDLYVQDYAHLYGLRTAVFRMSCIYGTRQFGVEDQGWLAWFTIAALTGQPITIFGDGRQVRDVLWVHDLVLAYERFIESDVPHGVFNLGGGPSFTLSLLELLDILSSHLGRPIEPSFADWRPSDQKVYVSDVRHVKDVLGWTPTTSPEAGVARLIAWVETNRERFATS